MELKATKRETTGKQVKNLRKEGLIPAVIYGPDFNPLSLSLNLKDFTKLYKEAGESTVVDLLIDGEKEPYKVLVKDAQNDPISGLPIHADFYKANLAEKVSVSVPVEIMGEPQIVKSGQGIILTLLNEITVEALPLDLPHDIKVDVNNLTEIGQGVTIKELPLDHAKVKILDHQPEDLVVMVDYAVQLEKEEEVKGVGEVEVTTEKPEETGGEASETRSKEEPKAEKEDQTTPSGKKEKK